MASFNIPASPSKYTMVVDTFRGVDLINSPTNVEKSRSPAAPNMIRDQVGKVRKRMGYRTVATAPEGARVNGVHFLGEERLLHAGAKLYRWEDGETGAVFTELGAMADARSVSFRFDDRLYLLDGTEYRVYDGSTLAAVSAGAYVPTVVISRNPTGGGTAYEALNLLGTRWRESFLGTAEDKTYQLTADGLDETPVTAELLNADGEWVAKTEGTDFTVDREKAMTHGMTVAQIYMQVAQALSGTTTGADMTLDGQDMTVTIGRPQEQQVTLDNLMDLEITPGSSAGSAMSSMSGGTGSSKSGSSLGGSSMSGSSMGSSAAAAASADSFKLGEVAALERTVSLSTISRQEQRRCITVTAAVDENHNVTRVSSEAIRAVEALALPAGTTAEFSGENETIMEAMQQLLLMLLLGILLVYLVMVAQFQSLKSPFIVMFTIPLAFTGGFIILLVCGVELSVVSLIGFVMLVGIIVNNGIVLVDYINQLRLEGMDRQEAIIEAGVTRLRPILMTSITTILGLLVMAFGGDAGTALMQPMALVCIGGLVYATLMTLLVVPCMYDIISRKELRKVSESDLSYEEKTPAETP